VLAKDGAKIMSGGNVFCEIWFRATTPPAGKVEESATLAIVHGALLGVIRFPGAGSDRRGQPVKPGIYTLRYSTYPVNGDHQGVAPQRDFLVLSPIAIDTDLNATPGFEPLMDLSRKASGTPHPAVLGLWKAEPVSSPSLKKEGDTDWVLQTKIGDTPVAVIVIGKTEA
jgi:hypothetical protein